MIYTMMDPNTHELIGYANVPDDRWVATKVKEDGSVVTTVDGSVITDAYFLPVLRTGEQVCLLPSTPKKEATDDHQG